MNSFKPPAHPGLTPGKPDWISKTTGAGSLSTEKELIQGKLKTQHFPFVFNGENPATGSPFAHGKFAFQKAGVQMGGSSLNGNCLFK
jgi:hypothetical protein